MTSRWANTKLRWNAKDSGMTSLYEHFRDGCPNNYGQEKNNIRISFIDFLDTTSEKLHEAHLAMCSLPCV